MIRRALPYIAKRTKWRLRFWIVGTATVMVGCAAAVLGLWTGLTLTRWGMTGFLALLFVYSWDNLDALRIEAKQRAVRERVLKGAIAYLERNK
jgi:hypothetical protein